MTSLFKPQAFCLALVLFAGTTAAHAQRNIYVDGTVIQCILPKSTCEVTEVKNADEAKYVGKTITLYSPSYSFDKLWYQMGIGTLADGSAVRINQFKLKVITQPDMPVAPACKPGAETAAGGFGIDTSQYVRILAIGSLDAAADQKAHFVNKVFKTKSIVSTLGDCWYSGMLAKDGKVFLMACMQVQRVTEADYRQDSPLAP